jgi:hypothetical protein
MYPWDNELVLDEVKNDEESADTALRTLDSALFFDPVDMKTISLLDDRL